MSQAKGNKAKGRQSTKGKNYYAAQVYVTQRNKIRKSHKLSRKLAKAKHKVKELGLLVKQACHEARDRNPDLNAKQVRAEAMQKLGISKTRYKLALAS